MSNRPYQYDLDSITALTKEPYFNFCQHWDVIEPYVLSLDGEPDYDTFTKGGNSPELVIDVRQIRYDLEKRSGPQQEHRDLLRKIADSTELSIAVFEVV